MGVQDLDARYAAIGPASGTVAETAVTSILAAARVINDAVHGEPYQLVTVLQQLETAAYQATRYLSFAPDSQPGIAPGEQYSSLTIDDLRSLVAQRNEGRDDGAKIPYTGSKDQLIARLVADDAQTMPPDPPQPVDV
jgi:hypothetical protein